MTYDSRPETQKHIERVQHFMGKATGNLDRRMINHDATKLVEPELSAFDEATPKLANLLYGSDEYRQAVKDLGPALKHHYEHNDHHPEHHQDGVAGMSAMALIEMICDWRAASERTKQRADGDTYLKKSFEEGLTYNQQRFGYGDELASVIYWTAFELGLVD